VRVAAYNRLSVYNASDSRAARPLCFFFARRRLTPGLIHAGRNFRRSSREFPARMGFAETPPGRPPTPRTTWRELQLVGRFLHDFRTGSGRIDSTKKNIQAIRCRPVYCTADTMHESNRNPRGQRCRFSFGSWACSVCVGPTFVARVAR